MGWRYGDERRECGEIRGKILEMAAGGRAENTGVHGKGRITEGKN